MALTAEEERELAEASTDELAYLLREHFAWRLYSRGDAPDYDSAFRETGYLRPGSKDPGPAHDRGRPNWALWERRGGWQDGS